MQFYTKKSGFTIVELIIVIVLIGIVAIIVNSRISDISFFQTSADIDQLISHIKYIQHKSMVSGGCWRIEFNASTDSYSIYDKNGNSVKFPDKNSNSVNLETDFTITKGGSPLSSPIYFDYIGRPCEDNLCKNRTTSQIRITCGSSNILIEPHSGGVYVE